MLVFSTSLIGLIDAIKCIFIFRTTQERSPTHQGLVSGYVSPEGARPEVYPWKIKPVKDTLVAHIREKDGRVYDKEDPKTDQRFVCDTAQMEYTVAHPENLRNLIERSGLYGDSRPPLLHPTRYRMLTRNNKAYRVGYGGFGRVFLAQDKDSGELVAIKGFKSTMDQQVVKECGYFHKAQQMLEDDNFEKAHLRGFLRIKQGTDMSKVMKPLMCVITLAGLTKGAVMQLALDVALDLAGNLGISASEWGDIIYSVVLAAKTFYDNGILHGDYSARNICVGYHDNRYKLTIIDFGLSCEQGEAGTEDEEDLFDAMKVVEKAARALNWKNTFNYAKKILRKQYNPGEVDWDNVLRVLESNINKDTSSSA